MTVGISVIDDGAEQDDVDVVLTKFATGGM